MSKVYVEFDGSSKGNPGRGGAGAILRSEDGTVIAKVGRGLGTTTNNAAEYEGLKLGLETARDLGYGHVHAQGDSQLVYKQVQGEWQTKNENMDRLCSDARELKGQFKSFDMSHVPRDYNSGADREANKAVNLPAGEVYKEHCGHEMSKVYLEFDGSSKGNPGRGGVGAVLRSQDGIVISRVREGLGTTTNNAAEC